MVKESVIADLFEFDEGEFECLIERSSNPGNPVILTRINDEDSLTYDLKAKIGGCDMFKGETSRKRSTRKISEENRTFQTGGVKENSMRLENNSSTSGNQNQIIFQNVLKEENQSKGRRFRLKPRGASNELNSPFILPRPRLFPRHNNIRKIIVNRKEQDDNNNDNDVNKPTSRKSEVKKPRTVPKKNFNKIPRTCFKALNSKEAEFIFKGFISDEDNSEIVDIKEKINMGKYHTPFYENIYTKYNGLDERLAFKRKNVCLKLLSILKIIVSVILYP